MDFARQHLVIDPMLALGEDDRLGEFADLLHTNMYPLGETDYGHAFLVIDEQGRVFEIFEDLYFVADGFDAALENLLNGLNRPRMVDADGYW